MGVGEPVGDPKRLPKKARAVRGSRSDRGVPTKLLESKVAARVRSTTPLFLGTLMLAPRHRPFLCPLFALDDAHMQGAIYNKCLLATFIGFGKN